MIQGLVAWADIPTFPCSIRYDHTDIYDSSKIDISLVTREKGLVGNWCKRRTLSSRCDICRTSGQNLSYDQHEQALLVKCLADPNATEEAKAELHQYLLSIKDMCEKDGLVGFAFQRSW